MFTIILISAFAAALLCTLILATSEFHIKYTGDATSGSAQKLHKQVVPRVGGIAVFSGLLIGMLAVGGQDANLAVDLLTILACLLPVYLTGFAEDITKKVSPSARYIAAALSGLLVSTVTDLRITHVDVWGIDALVAIPVIGMMFFVFAVASVSHAFNLIDGQNGLCAGVTIITCLAIMGQAYQYDLNTPLLLATLCAAANIGFLIFNYPFGRIFLGDAGAYLNGTVVAVATVQLIQGSGTLSPWYAVALLIYPIWETLFSMFRRISSGRSFSEPDSEHLHSLYFKAIRKYDGLWAKSSAPALWVLCAVFATIAAAISHSTLLCIVLIGLFCICYQLLYRHAHKVAQ